MAWTSRPFSVAGAAARLHELEEKVKAIDPTNPPDLVALTARLDALTAAVNRCYNWSFAGAINDNVDANDDLISITQTYGNNFWFNHNDTNGDGYTETNKNLVSVVFSNWDVLQKFTNGGSVLDSIYGSDILEWNFLNFTSPIDGVPRSLAEACFRYSNDINAHFLDGGKPLLQEIQQLRADLETALETIASLSARVSSLESA